MELVEDTTIVSDGEKIILKIAMAEVPEVEKPSTDQNLYANQRGTADKVLKKLENTFESGLQVAKNCARLAARSFNDMPPNERPEEVQLQLGINLGTKAGAVVAEVSANA